MTPIEGVIETIMARGHAASGTAVFLDRVLLRQLLHGILQQVGYDAFQEGFECGLLMKEHVQLAIQEAWEASTTRKELEDAS